MMNQTTERLKQIKANCKRGRMTFVDMNWLYNEVELLVAMVALQKHNLENANKRIKELESDGRKNR
jgi:hypothetical protein